ncbi:Peptidase family M23 [Paramicrobacterium humi]|uniref:Peptidase family M23 n=1 Tax=Paramicrobacterium humi TaxID=640635 RepID=A0A1H4TQ02_9MICO|nr:M23 family metallopeptidase [Microbacterium humi]SEC58171.1 Peptidase family M23 [Microbacterium humi]
MLAVTLILADAPAAAARAASDDAYGSWAWPVEHARAIDRDFEAPASPYGPGHRGIDVRARSGDELKAPANGVVRFAGIVVNRPVLTIEHANGVLSSYEAVDATVAVGDPVERGEVVGTVVDGPHCGAGCVHVGVRIDGAYVNPLLFLGGVPRAVLLPMG